MGQQIGSDLDERGHREDEESGLWIAKGQNVDCGEKTGQLSNEREILESFHAVSGESTVRPATAMV